MRTDRRRKPKECALPPINSFLLVTFTLMAFSSFRQKVVTSLPLASSKVYPGWVHPTAELVRADARN